MKISEVSEQSGISLDPLRYYERIGPIPPYLEMKVASGIATKSMCGGLNSLSV